MRVGIAPGRTCLVAAGSLLAMACVGPHSAVDDVADAVRRVWDAELPYEEVLVVRVDEVLVGRCQQFVRRGRRLDFLLTGVGRVGIDHPERCPRSMAAVAARDVDLAVPVWTPGYGKEIGRLSRDSIRELRSALDRERHDLVMDIRRRLDVLGAHRGAPDGRVTEAIVLWKAVVSRAVHPAEANTVADQLLADPDPRIDDALLYEAQGWGTAAERPLPMTIAAGGVYWENVQTVENLVVFLLTSRLGWESWVLERSSAQRDLRLLGLALELRRRGVAIGRAPVVDR